MYKNKFALKPGEKLTPQKLFDRYVDWKIYSDSVHAKGRKSDCDNDLFDGHLCCKHHFQISHEYDDFFRYLCHLKMIDYSNTAISYDLIRSFIKSFDLNYDIAKLAKFMNMSWMELYEFMR